MDFTSDSRSTDELIFSIIERVRNGYYYEDGDLVEDWLRTDLEQIVRKSPMEVTLDLDSLPKRKPHVTFYREEDDPGEFVE